MDLLKAYLKDLEGCRDIEIINIIDTIPNTYIVTYKVIRKDDNFIREKQEIKILDLIEFLYTIT